jgi:lysophospholipase L1-like esterase
MHPNEPDAEVARPLGVLWSKPVRALATLLALAVAAQLVPRLERLRVLSPRPHDAREPAPLSTSRAVGETELEIATEARSDLAQPTELAPPPRAGGPIAREPSTEEAARPDGERSPVPIVDESRSLDHLFAALEHTERHEPGAVSRILFFGDSIVASDFGTGTLRRLLDARFGDAGHGFVLVANAWPQYFHNDVYRLADRGFRVSRIVGPRVLDGLYGLGGVSFTGPPGLRSRLGTAKSGEFGRSVSRFDIAYLAQPGGGLLAVSVDGRPVRTIDTDAPEKRSGFAEVRVPDGPHELELLTQRGSVRLFGVALERDAPGVVLDAIGVVGARLRTLDESDDAHFAEALAWRKPNLVVYQFGANESGDGFAYSMADYHRTAKELIGKVAKAVPTAGCLVIGAMDRARKEGDRLVTVPVIPLIVEEQRKVAAELGCAYFSAYDAMGGKGSMARWVRLGLGTGDFTHPTSWGADKLGHWIYSALMTRYDEYRRTPAH